MSAGGVGAVAVARERQAHLAVLAAKQEFTHPQIVVEAVRQQYRGPHAARCIVEALDHDAVGLRVAVEVLCRDAEAAGGCREQALPSLGDEFAAEGVA